MKYILLSFSFLLVLFGQSQVWVTSADQNMLLKKRDIVVANDEKKLPFIEVNDKIRFQTVDGFGFTLTGGSAQLINKMEASQKINLLQELFGSNENSIGISYLRLSIGASDLDSFVFSYDDLPLGETDPELRKFSLSSDTINLIPILKRVLKINPDIKNKPAESRIRELITEAVNFECEFITEALPVSLIGMNSDMMKEYIRFCADRLMRQLGYSEIYNSKNPFDWMELISMQGKTNFFERKVSEYQKAGVVNSTKEGVGNNFSFSTDIDF